MLSIRIRPVSAFKLLVAASFMMLFSACQMNEMTRNGGCCGDDCPGHARVCEKPTVRALASDLDSLERHIECYGSVAIQHPSVWGQARLTKHREEFEKLMRCELCGFQQTLQGSLARSDQAYYINAISLGIAASGPNAFVTPSASASSSTTTIQTPTADSITPIQLTQNDARLPTATGFSSLSSKGITTEPSIYLNQKARYIQHLQELRRINEGDDTGDSPGYALNLIRVPVSILPGKCTQEGHGAEVTMTLKPYLSNELLPTTFRNLVVNDLLEVIGVPMTQFLNDCEQVAHYHIVLQVFDTEYEIWKNMKKVRNLQYKDLTQPSKTLLSSSPLASSLGLDSTSTDKNAKTNPRTTETSWTSAQQLLKGAPATVSASKLRHAKRPFPPSQIIDIFGENECETVVTAAYKQFKRDPANKYWIHYPDVQGYLQEELQGAYRFLADPTNMSLWEYCNQELVTAIRTRQIEKIARMRNRFGDQVLATTKRVMDDDVTVTLAWTIIVESALLTDQLVQDMKESAAAKNCTCPHPEWQPYYLPNPPAETRHAFNRYVECRWPIIVFALDPVTEQQNIADSYSSRREMQLALSMAFVSGNLSAKKMTQYARRLEMEMETVALNNTQVGFSHGSETFGWRFYPRYQTPDTESNLTVFFRDQLIGGPNRNALLRMRKLEPGQRECTAIVIMPSFVPYCSLETSSTWFKLTNPKCKDMTCVDAVKLSARVKAIENCSPRVTDANCYRDGEIGRLLNRAKQLETRLPLQSTMVQIPYENTLGGFAMFNTGVTDLAPELYGWYGAPGIDTSDFTTIFLIGNHFSVHHTKVVVGGINVTDTEMLSRQVMRVTIPKGALKIDRCTGSFAECPRPACACPTDAATPAAAPQAAGGAPMALASVGTPTQRTASPAGNTTPASATPTCTTCSSKAGQGLFVDVHVATPYGVTSHLLIPACNTGSKDGNLRQTQLLTAAPWTCPCSTTQADGGTASPTPAPKQKAAEPSPIKGEPPATTNAPPAKSPTPSNDTTPSKNTTPAKETTMGSAREIEVSEPPVNMVQPVLRLDRAPPAASDR